MKLKGFNTEASEHLAGELGHPKPTEVFFFPCVALILTVMEDFSAEVCG